MKKLLSFIVCVVMFVTSVSAATYHGVDIYHGTSENGQINWQKLAQQKDFVYIKSTEGEHSTDSMFKANMNGAKAIGMKWGAYHFLRMYSTASAVKQADFFYRLIKGTGYTLVPCVDCESYDGQQTAAGIRACIRAFVNEFYRISGSKPIIYCSTSYANDILRGQFVDCKLWQADYRGYAGTITGWQWSAWQYSGSGSISAIANREVDLDIATSDIFLNAPKAAANNGVYAVSGMPYAWNSTAGITFQVYNSAGKPILGRSVDKGDHICILSVDYARQLAEVVYPVSGGYIHGYIKNSESQLHNRYYSGWQNGSTREPVYDATGKEIANFRPYVKATILYRKGNLTCVLYSTSKGSETKTGFVKFGGVR